MSKYIWVDGELITEEEARKLEKRRRYNQEREKIEREFERKVKYLRGSWNEEDQSHMRDAERARDKSSEFWRKLLYQ